MSSCKLGAICLSALLGCFSVAGCAGGARQSSGSGSAEQLAAEASGREFAEGRRALGAETPRGGARPPQCEGIAGPAGDVRTTCDDNQLRFEARIFKGPKTLALTPAAVRLLDDVAALMEQYPSLLLLRIEVHWDGAPPADSKARRSLMDRAQARADLLFLELWTKRGVWAERLDAVGYGAEGASLRRFEAAMSERSLARGADYPWRVVLRAVQWSAGSHRP